MEIESSKFAARSAFSVLFIGQVIVPAEKNWPEFTPIERPNFPMFYQDEEGRCYIRGAAGLSEVGASFHQSYCRRNHAKFRGYCPVNMHEKFELY